eukprot:s4151_g2.t1
MRSAVVREQKVVHAVLSFLAGVPVVGGQLSESLFLRKLKLHEVVTGALPVRIGSTGSLLAPNRVVSGCPPAGCKSVSWMPPAGQVVTLPAFMAPLGSLQVPAGRTMLTSPGRSVTDGRASPAGVGSIPAGSLHLPPSHPNGTMLTSPGRTVKADGRASPAGVGSGLVGSLHLPPSHPNGLASPGGLLPPPTAKSPPPNHQAPQSPHQFAGILPAHPATFVGTPPRAVGGTGPVLYQGSPGQLSPSTGSLVAPPALLSPQSFSLTVNPAQVSVGSPQCSARSPYNLVRSANSFSSGIPAGQKSTTESDVSLAKGSAWLALPGRGPSRYAWRGALLYKECLALFGAVVSARGSSPGAGWPRLEVRATSAPVAKPLATALGDAPIVASGRRTRWLTLRAQLQKGFVMLRNVPVKNAEDCTPKEPLVLKPGSLLVGVWGLRYSFL